MTAHDADTLRRELRALASTLRPGDQFLTITEIMTRYGVGKNLASKVVVGLKESGILSGPAGGRTWVRVRPQQIKRHNLRYHEEKRAVLETESNRSRIGVAETDSGISVQALFEDNYKYDVVTPSEDIRAALNLAPEAKALRRIYTRRHAAMAGASTSVSHIPYDLASKNPDLLNSDKEPWPGGTMHQLYTIGIELTRIDDHVVSSMPSSDEVKLLDVPPGVPMLRIRKISYAGDTPVEVSDIPLPGDRVELVYTTPLEPW